MGKSQRTKGHSFERLIAQMVRAFWPDAYRGNQRYKGSREADVEGTPFHFECKKGKRPNIIAAMKQADERAGLRPTAVVSRVDYGPILVTIHYSTFEELLRGAFPISKAPDSPGGPTELLQDVRPAGLQPSAPPGDAQRLLFDSGGSGDPEPGDETW